MKLSTTRDVRAFLAKNQPMPGELDEEYDCDAYADAVNLLEQEPDEEAADLFLASLRRGSDLSLVQSFSCILEAMDRNVVRALLARHIATGPYDKRAFAAEYVATFPDPTHIPGLAELLRADGAGGEVGLAAHWALEVISDEYPESPAGDTDRKYFWEGARWAAEREALKRLDAHDRLLRVRHAEESAKLAFRAGRHTDVVGLLEEFEGEISDVSRKRLSMSRKAGGSVL